MVICLGEQELELEVLISLTERDVSMIDIFCYCPGKTPAHHLVCRLLQRICLQHPGKDAAE